MMTVLVPLPGYGLLEKLSLELLASSAPWDSYFVSPGALFSAVGCNHFHFNKSICNNCLNSVLKPTEEKEMTTHSSTLAWKILWTEEPGRLQSMGSLRVGNDFTLIFSLSCIGEGNGNPLQCSCLENPRDGGAWWAAVYGVTQIRTRLKWLSSSSSILYWCISFWLTSLCIIGPSFIHLIRTDSNVFFLMAE